MSTPGPVIHVVDDDERFRNALARLLKTCGYEVRSYASAGDFLEAPKAHGCLLLDIRMPGSSGLELQQALAQRDDALPVIFLTGHGDIPTSVSAFKRGAADFLTKPVNRKDLLSAIERVLAQDSGAQAAREERQSLRTCYETLTPREREVLVGVVSGRLNRQIASSLGMSERTVKAHRARIMEKMGVGSVAELTRAWDRLNPSRVEAPVSRRLD